MPAGTPHVRLQLTIPAPQVGLCKSIRASESMTAYSKARVSRRQLLTAAAGVVGAAGLAGMSRANSKASGTTFVLVHGAWHGGWCWRRVADRLSSKGHYVVAPTLSGVGERSHLAGDSIDLTTHIDDMSGEIEWKDLEDIVLVGHSYGGMVITGVAERLRERIAAIVYLDAFLPDDGQSVADMSGDFPWPKHMVPPISAKNFHVNANDRAWVDAKMTSHPVRCFTQKLQVSGAYQSIARKVYIRAPAFELPAFDRALGRCRASDEWTTVTMTCGHDVMVDQPTKLTAILERLAVGV
jgi:pimeloyl-ACP methyl ester carboxylesterase